MPALHVKYWITFHSEAPPGFEPGMEVLQTSALPLGYGAATRSVWLDPSKRSLPPAVATRGNIESNDTIALSQAYLTPRRVCAPFSSP